MREIEQWLREQMGLSAESIGVSSLERTVRLRMKASGVATPEAYHERLHASPAEATELIEALVIPETWFFRDRQAFDALAELVTREPRFATARCRLLSVPCSTGEEPLSLAMTLLDAGLPAARFSIDALDISHRALERARAARYGRNSFRGAELAFRERHFQPDGDAWVPNATVRESVQFQPANLLAPDIAAGRERYHFIFCRNLLIYFDRATQRRAFAQLTTLLADDGTLFLGPAEVPLAIENGFAPIALPMAFACRRASATAPRPRPASPRAKPVAAPTPSVPRRETTPAKTTAKRSPAPAEAQNILASARQLADGGQFADAARLCHERLAQHGPCPHVYYLLGVIGEAQGDAQAPEFYRKALYLDPAHPEALLQLALRAERDGDLRTARNFRRRVNRPPGGPA